VGLKMVLRAIWVIISFLAKIGKWIFTNKNIDHIGILRCPKGTSNNRKAASF
jgi:hypothetical protein